MEPIWFFGMGARTETSSVQKQHNNDIKLHIGFVFVSTMSFRNHTNDQGSVTWGDQNSRRGVEFFSMGGMQERSCFAYAAAVSAA